MTRYPTKDRGDAEALQSRFKLIRGELNGRGLRIGIVVSRFNHAITQRLLEGAEQALEEAGVSAGTVTTVSVPGAFEIPGAAKQLACRNKVDAIVCLGAVVRGQTEHFTYVSKAVQEGVLAVSLETGVPITFGVLTTDDFEQAMDRTGGHLGHKGYEAAQDAVEMANTYRLIG
jgi:6,7-dimethyl-8-ribityllumazine synthase